MIVYLSFLNEESYPLAKWYNQLIDRTIHEITVADVLRKILQKQFSDLAASKAIEFLYENIFAGGSHDGGQEVFKENRKGYRRILKNEKSPF